jgi:prepilin peptidase CpaA
MESWIFILVPAALAVTAAAFDLKSRRIPNLLTLLIAATGMAASTVNPEITFAQATIGLLIGLLIPFVLFALGMLGAGDAKLLAGIGAWVGPIGIVWVMLFTAVAGGVMALVASTAQGQLRPALRNTGLVGMSLLMTRRTNWVSATDAARADDKKNLTLPYAIAIVVGLVTTQALLAMHVVG